jgi:hypothetical protein
MDTEEIIAKIQANQWWPFDRVDPSILQEIMRRDKEQTKEDIGDAPL